VGGRLKPETIHAAAGANTPAHVPKTSNAHGRFHDEYENRICALGSFQKQMVFEPPAEGVVGAMTLVVATDSL